MWIQRNAARLPMVIVALVLRLPIATSQVVARPVAAPVPDADSVAARNEFAWELLRKVALQKPDTNVVLAPLGISATMALVHEGARGETAAEMARTLRLTGPGDDPTALLDKLQTTSVRPVEGLSLGVGMTSNGGYGVRITDVPSGSAADRAGLKPGDLILAVDGRPTRAKPRLVESLARAGRRSSSSFSSTNLVACSIVKSYSTGPSSRLPAVDHRCPLSSHGRSGLRLARRSSLGFKKSPRGGTEPNCLRPTSAATAPALSNRSTPGLPTSRLAKDQSR